jgi:hypothetical protein
MNTHADVFSYAGDGIFTITEEDLREVLKSLHVANVVEHGRLDKMMEFKEAMWDYKQSMLDAVASDELRDLVEKEMESDLWGALANYTMSSAKR